MIPCTCGAKEGKRDDWMVGWVMLDAVAGRANVFLDKRVADRLKLPYVIVHAEDCMLVTSAPEASKLKMLP